MKIQEIEELLQEIKYNLKGGYNEVLVETLSNGIHELIDQQQADLLESYKAIATYCTYIEDGDKWCDVCGGVDDKFSRDNILHLDDNCIVLKADKFIKEHE